MPLVGVTSYGHGTRLHFNAYFDTEVWPYLDEVTTP
jgi:hypothetical protein